MKIRITDPNIEITFHYKIPITLSGKNRSDGIDTYDVPDEVGKQLIRNNNAVEVKETENDTRNQ